MRVFGLWFAALIVAVIAYFVARQRNEDSSRRQAVWRVRVPLALTVIEAFSRARSVLEVWGLVAAQAGERRHLQLRAADESYLRAPWRRRSKSLSR